MEYSDQYRFEQLRYEVIQALRDGYRRACRIHDQGRHLSELEGLLEIVRDLELLVFSEGDRTNGQEEKSNDTKYKIEIPFACVASSPAAEDRDMTILTPFKPPYSGIYDRPVDVCKQSSKGMIAERIDLEIHTVLSRQIKDRIGKGDAFLQDYLLLEERHNGQKLDPSRQEASKKAIKPLFGAEDDSRDGLPHRLTATDSLFRVAFDYPRKEAERNVERFSIILGIDCLSGNEARKIHEEEVADRCVEHISPTLLLEAQNYFSKFIHFQNDPRAADYKAPPSERKDFSSLRIDMSELAQEMDDITQEIDILARRAGKPDWGGASSGFNFVAAFRKVDKDGNGHLSYELSPQNIDALARHFENPEQWRQKIDSRLLRTRDDLENMIRRTDPDATERNIKTKTDRYLDECKKVIGEKFGAFKTMKELQESCESIIEKVKYPIRKTPGHSLMITRRSEIIENWLKDPRARGFHDDDDGYPHLLYAWESYALPEKIYYSAIVDGIVPIGISAVKADILDLCETYELQEIIDKGAPRLRTAIINHELGDFEKEISEMVSRRGSEYSDLDLAVSALRGFRKLAYYYLPAPDDYFTKIVEEESMRHLFEGDWKFKSSHDERQKWGVLERQLSKGDFKKIVALSNRLQNRKEEDIRKDSIKIFAAGDKSSEKIPKSKLYRIGIDAFSYHLVMLVLIPSREMQQLAESLVRRFSKTLNNAIRTNLIAPQGRIYGDVMHTFVNVSRLLRLGLEEFEDSRHLRTLIDIIEAETSISASMYQKTGVDNTPFLKPDKSEARITVRDLRCLLEEIEEVLGFLATARDGWRGTGGFPVGNFNIQFFKEAMGYLYESPHIGEVENQRLGITRDIGLLLLWEISLNLLRHCSGEASFVIDKSANGLVRFTVRNLAENITDVTLGDANTPRRLRYLDGLCRAYGIGFHVDTEENRYFINTFFFPNED